MKAFVCEVWMEFCLFWSALVDGRVGHTWRERREMGASLRGDDDDYYYSLDSYYRSLIPYFKI